VGLVLQYPEYQLFEETVEKDIAFGPVNMGLDEGEIKNRVLDAVKFVGLDTDLLQKSPFDLSGGQKRRVAIAGIIAMRPEILVLDEPAAGLDPTGRNEIFEGLVRYRNETGATVIIVSHSMEDMAKIADHMIVTAGGRCVMQGGCDEIFSRAGELRKIGLDTPQITGLFVLLKAKGLHVSESIFTVEAAKAEILKLLGKRGDRRE
jgi:energy-coupling factor transport system ATP-binding protein